MGAELKGKKKNKEEKKPVKMKISKIASKNSPLPTLAHHWIEVCEV